MKIHEGKTEIVHEGICHLGEGPVWHAADRRLYWTDILERRLWVFDPADGSSRVFWEGKHRVGGFCFTVSGGMMLFTDRGVFGLSPEQRGDVHAEPGLLFDVPLAQDEMFNDITVDPAGRVYAGTLNKANHSNGLLYRFERGKQPAVLLNGLACSNGMAFSMSEQFFFHTDTLKYTITRYDYEKATGDIRNPQIYYLGEPSEGYPDGMTVDTEDHIWAAFWGGSAVRRLDPAGRVAEEIPLPAMQPSSVMFGGDDLQDLYITSACEGAADIRAGLDAQGRFLGGPLYRCRLPVKGRAEWLADF